MKKRFFVTGISLFFILIASFIPIKSLIATNDSFNFNPSSINLTVKDDDNIGQNTLIYYKNSNTSNAVKNIKISFKGDIKKLNMSILSMYKELASGEIGGLSLTITAGYGTAAGKYVGSILFEGTVVSTNNKISKELPVTIVVPNRPAIIFDSFTANGKSSSTSVSFTGSFNLELIVKNIGNIPTNGFTITLGGKPDAWKINNGTPLTVSVPNLKKYSDKYKVVWKITPNTKTKADLSVTSSFTPSPNSIKIKITSN
jgi:hypothetical protein